jgi:beta-lactam-binding protein with PASTA domain
LASPFDISPLASRVDLDDRGAGETTFTVKNVGAESIWGRATVLPDREERRGWFSIDRPERDFQAGEVEQIVVRLAIPAGKPTGPSSFRLHVASIKRGDEDFSVGAPIGFEIKPIEPPDTGGTSCGLRCWLLIAAAVVAVLIVAALLLWPGGTSVPEVVGQPIAEATRALEDEGLAVRTVTEVSDKPAGTVLRQTPDAGEPVTGEGMVVELIVAGGFVPVPDVTGRPVAQAQRELNAAGFAKTRVVERGDGTLGVVKGTNPRTGVPTAPDTEVDLVVPVPVVVPAVANRTETEARVALQNAGLRVGDVIRSGGGGNARVLSVTPAAGTPVGRGHAVTLHVHATP